MHGALQGNMQVRFMDWCSDLKRLQSQSGASQITSTALTEPEWLRRIPQIREYATFDVVLGSDILYEVGLALLNSPIVSVHLDRLFANSLSWRDSKWTQHCCLVPQDNNACERSCCRHAAVPCTPASHKLHVGAPCKAAGSMDEAATMLCSAVQAAEPSRAHAEVASGCRSPMQQ